MIGLAALAQGYIAHRTVPVRLSREQVDLVAKECRVPRSWLRLHRDGTVGLRVPASATYEQVGCLVRETRVVSDHKPVEKPE